MNPARGSLEGKTEGRNVPKLLCVHVYECLAATRVCARVFMWLYLTHPVPDQFLSALDFGMLKFVGLSKPLLLEMSASELRVPEHGVRLGVAGRKDGTRFSCHPDSVF